MFEIKKNPDRVLILATGAGWEAAPQESEAIIYCLNDYANVEKFRILPDVLFMMDILDEKPQIVSAQDNLGKIVAKINELKVPFVGPYKYAEISLSEAFPLKECVEKYGAPYFTNTICYMIAYALMSGAKEIELYGVNQAGSHEYAEERGGVEYWLGIAVGLGVKVTINGQNSTLLRFKGRYDGDGLMYGYLQSYRQFIEGQNKFGEQIVRRLSAPRKDNSRIIKRTINHGTKNAI